MSFGPGMHKTIARYRPTAVQIPLSGELITTSLERSLKRLGTDYVDILALHDPDPQEMMRDDVRAALDKVIASGRAREVGIAGSFEAADIALRLELPIGHIQIANNPLQPQFERLATAVASGSREVYISTYSAFGSRNTVARLTNAVRSNPDAKDLLRQTGYEPPIENAVRCGLVDYALKSNAAGTVLFSMFSPGNLCV